MNEAKKVKFYENGKCGYGWIVIEEENVYYKHCNGCMPHVCNVLLAMLSDKDIYRMAKEYVEKKLRKKTFEITTKVRCSDCEDIYLNLIEWFAGKPHIVKREKLLHISCAGKLNEGMNPLYIGDFVELIAYISRKDGCNYGMMHRKMLRKISGFHYTWEREIGWGTQWISNIFKESVVEE